MAISIRPVHITTCSVGHDTQGTVLRRRLERSAGTRIVFEYINPTLVITIDK